MSRKTRGKEVAITGVVAFGTPDEHERFQRMENLLSPCIGESAVYGIGLTYPPPGVLPAEEAAVSALVSSPSGKVFGVTSGRASHLIRMPKPFQIADAGVIRGVTQATPDLVVDAKGIVYGSGLDRGAPVFAYRSREAFLTAYRNAPGRLGRLFIPFRDDGVGGLALSTNGRTLAVVGAQTGRLCLYDLKTRKRRTLPRLAPGGEASSTRLGAMADGSLCTTGADGELICISPKGTVTRTGMHLPCAKGKNYVARATAFTRTASGVLYGGTEEGLLFSLRDEGRTLLSHGCAADLPDLHCLAEGADDMIYGIAGRGDSISHLVRFDPARGAWKDLGLFASHGHFPWVAYQIRALAACPDGRLIAGESDRFGHLFAYHPPITREV